MEKEGPLSGLFLLESLFCLHSYAPLLKIDRWKPPTVQLWKTTEYLKLKKKQKNPLPFANLVTEHGFGAKELKTKKT